MKTIPLDITLPGFEGLQYKKFILNDPVPKKRTTDIVSSTMDSTEQVFDPTKTAVICCMFGQKPARINAIKNTLRKWMDQEYQGSIYIEEVMFPGDTPDVYKAEIVLLSSKFSVKYTRTFGTDNNKDIFQKEVLYNRQAAKASADNKQVLIFIDTDVWSKDAKWWLKISEQANYDECAVVQGFSSYKDSVDVKRTGWSFGATTAYPPIIPGDVLYAHPGFCWAISTAYWKSIHGWNEYFIAGSGDVGFIYECVPGYGFTTVQQKWKWIKDLIRLDTPHGILTFVDVPVIHEHHGPFIERSYNASRFVIDWFNIDIRSVVRKDVNGLLSWCNPKDKMRYVLRDKALMRDSMEKALEICKKHGVVFDKKPF